MKRLIYTFERVRVAPGAHGPRPILEEAMLGITMAGLGLSGIQRRVDGATEPPRVTITFPDDKTLLRFNLRIERALAVRGVRIQKIRFADEPSPRKSARAVA